MQNFKMYNLAFILLLAPPIYICFSAQSSPSSTLANKIYMENSWKIRKQLMNNSGFHALRIVSLKRHKVHLTCPAEEEKTLTNYQNNCIQYQHIISVTLKDKSCFPWITLKAICKLAQFPLTVICVQLV